MSGHRAAYGSARHPRNSSTGPSSALASAASAWEDDAWKIDSDDEEFVKASRLNANPASPSTSAVTRLTMLSNGKAPYSADGQRHEHPTVGSAGQQSDSSQTDEGSCQHTTKHDERTESGQWTMIDRKSARGDDAALAVRAETSNAAPSSSSTRSPRQIKNRELEGALREDINDVLKGEHSSNLKAAASDLRLFVRLQIPLICLQDCELEANHMQGMSPARVCLTCRMRSRPRAPLAGVLGQRMTRRMRL